MASIIPARALPSARSDVQSIRAFYMRNGAENPYRHAHQVYRKAARYGIIDEGLIRDPRASAELRRSHVLLRRLALFHVLDSERIRENPNVLPLGCSDERLIRELEIFDLLTDLERRGAYREEYFELLGGKVLALAPLIKIPDCSLTHDTEDQLSGFIADGRPSLIRQYASHEEAIGTMRTDLKAAEKLWAPLAGFYGFQELAGDIFLQSYRVNHPEIYERVTREIVEHHFYEQLLRTQALTMRLSKILAGQLANYGFDATVSVRKNKHPGKMMEKMERIIRKDYEKLEPEDRPRSSVAYLLSRVPGFDLRLFSDLVAVRVVADSYQGRSIDDAIKGGGGVVESGAQNDAVPLHRLSHLLDAIRSPALKVAARLIGDALEMLGFTSPEMTSSSYCDIEYVCKENGYCGFHFDFKAGSASAPILPFEIQLRTTEWDFISQHGGAAHYLYKGEGCDPELIENLGNSYRSIIAPPEPARKSRNCYAAPAK